MVILAMGCQALLLQETFSQGRESEYRASNAKGMDVEGAGKMVHPLRAGAAASITTSK